MSNKSFLDDMNNNNKPESFREEEFIKHKRNLLPSIITGSAILIAAVLLILVFAWGAELPDMSGWSKADVKTWADKINVTVIYIDEYSSEFDADAVIESNPEFGARIKRNGNLTVTVSKGADPNERIVFPDIKLMDLNEINEWIEDNKLTGVTIRKENNSVVEENSVINYEVVDGSEDDFLRKNRVRIYISLGPSVLDETVMVPDFFGTDKSQILRWMNDYGITVEFIEEFSDFVENGRVSAQSIQSYTKMNRSDKLVITMSLGRAIRVPVFIEMSKTEAMDAASNLGIQLQYKNEVSSKPVGTVLNQDIEPGTDIHSKQIVTLTLASESEFVILPDFIGMTASDASTLAGIKDIKILLVDKMGSEASGKVIGMSIAAGTEINKQDVVIIYVSIGNVYVPDFSKMTKAEVQLWSQMNYTDVTFIERYTDEYPDGRLYGQNFVNTLLPKDKKLIVYYSLGQVAVLDFTGASKLDVYEWQRQVNEKGAEISLKFHSVYVPGKEANRVIDQSVKNDFIPAQSRIDFWVTENGMVTIPDMTAVPESDFIEWCAANKIPYSIIDRYSSEYNNNVLFGQNFKDRVLPEGSELIIYRSLGKPKVINLSGYTKTEAEGWLNGINLLGAGLSFEIRYVPSDGVAINSVVSQTPIEKWVELGSVIKIALSSGPEN
ncbi:MAG: PASTA domain-containing protein [Clostridia bacterium]|nr:PASTA domain-containing protein [Clostridia bacterium]